MKSKTNIIALAILAILAFWCIGKYNAMAVARENVDKTWGNVESQYQRRNDLIPNIMRAVKAGTKIEKETLEAVVNARSKATQITIDPSEATPEQLAAYQKAQGELGSALGRLLAITEAYPELSTNEQFMDLRKQLEGTENRIAVARNQFNEEAKNFNKLIVVFPNNLIAQFAGFKRRAYFEAEEGANKAPVVNFD